ncbi:MAG: hypothetical protein ACJAQ6_001312 [Arenicella sp.]|jgi:hypothetical protein
MRPIALLAIFSTKSEDITGISIRSSSYAEVSIGVFDDKQCVWRHYEDYSLEIQHPLPTHLHSIMA